MKTTLIFFFAFIACAFALTISSYSTRYEHINLDDVLYNNRLLKNTYKCMIGTGRCTAEANKLKAYFPDMLETKCSKCTPRQKKKIKKAVTFLMKHKPEMWEGLLDKYDPKRELSKDMLTDPNFLGKI
ncbi:ejaculatory bulb-specific protein 3 precursor, putative [Pediculus humanus corporis]|uniref:Ejaculatory bulb-specific protein 3, putative n=1 Tax=Pediculus humanus subsp. corporis TaxID=121224 RepID=E0W2K2_PEDHC|nr:ejaculatory bulb-specific protein 3 precursor, putative [Pediculus humanus corporis]EEB19858.1 ejaculatory bulb-specific protein 3 precursor, putative [Pediculus humanus corporis]